MYDEVSLRAHPIKDIITNNVDPYVSTGTCHYQNGNIYTGSWKAGMACGTGTQTFGNGDRYEGEWKAGMMSGQVLN